MFCYYHLKPIFQGYALNNRGHHLSTEAAVRTTTTTGYAEQPPMPVQWAVASSLLLAGVRPAPARGNPCFHGA